MKIFIVGHAASSIESTCKEVCNLYPAIVHIRANMWVELSAPQLSAESGADYSVRLAKEFVNTVVKNPDTGINYVNRCLPKESNEQPVQVIVSGVFSPRDLLAVLRPNDKVFFVSGVRLKPVSTYKKDGVSSILNVLVFLREHSGFKSAQHCLETDLLSAVIEYVKCADIITDIKPKQCLG